jgi:ATP-binding cassette subfamily C protein CydD
MALGLRLLWGQLDVRTALAVLLVAPEIFVPLRRAGAEFHASTEGQAAAARILEILQVPGDPPGAAPARRDATPANPVALHIDGLRIAYEHRAAPALDGFSLHVPPGARAALIGPSGSGKSSVLAALLGFALPTAGSMSVGSTKSSDCPVAAWRAHFSWVPQRPHLFTATLAENLRLGAPEATDQALEEVSEAVGLRELVTHLPLGLMTPLGQDGLTLSAGERQRVALARALLSPAPILLLDEPTASLDLPSARRIGAAVEPWLAQRTVIVAAHEPLLLDRFDLVVELTTSPLTAVGP